MRLRTVLGSWRLCAHLVRADLRAAFRRSLLGPLWFFVQPVASALLLGAVYSRLLGVDAATYIPGLFVAMVLWQFISASACNGSTALIQAAPYVQSFSQPLELYTLRSTLVAAAILTFNMLVVCVLAALLRPGDVWWGWPAVLLAIPAGIAIGWPLATVLGVLSTKWRDIPPMVGVAMQALWLVTPILVDESTYRARGFGWLADANPAYHFIELVRRPLLAGEWPRPASLAVTALFAAALAGLAGITLRLCRNRVALWL